MDKDRVKGAIDDSAGRVKRQVGEWTGNADLQTEGAAQQIKGKAEKAVGKVKDAVRNAQADAEAEQKRNEERNEEFERDSKYTPAQSHVSHHH